MTKTFLIASLVAFPLSAVPARSPPPLEAASAPRTVVLTRVEATRGSILLCGGGTTSEQQGQPKRPQPPKPPKPSGGGRGKETGGKTVSG